MIVTNSLDIQMHSYDLGSFSKCFKFYQEMIFTLTYFLMTDVFSVYTYITKSFVIQQLTEFELYDLSVYFFLVVDFLYL